jgi:hypothetical protein
MGLVVFVETISMLPPVKLDRLRRFKLELPTGPPPGITSFQ